jgi:hypothetical protein
MKIYSIDFLTNEAYSSIIKPKKIIRLIKHSVRKSAFSPHIKTTYIVIPKDSQ